MINTDFIDLIQVCIGVFSDLHHLNCILFISLNSVLYIQLLILYTYLNIHSYLDVLKYSSNRPSLILIAMCSTTSAP